MVWNSGLATFLNLSNMEFGLQWDASDEVVSLKLGKSNFRVCTIVPFLFQIYSYVGNRTLTQFLYPLFFSAGSRKGPVNRTWRPKFCSECRTRTTTSLEFSEWNLALCFFHTQTISWYWLTMLTATVEACISGFWLEPRQLKCDITGSSGLKAHLIQHMEPLEYQCSGPDKAEL